MKTRISKFLNTATESGLSVAVRQTVKFLDPSLDFRNAIKFWDPKIALSCDIKTELPDTTILPHPVGIVIGSSAEIGANVRIYQNVTVGWTLGDETRTAATIRDDVTIYSGAAIIGDVTIGEGAVIGSNAVVLEDVGRDTTVVGAPAREA